MRNTRFASLALAGGAAAMLLVGCTVRMTGHATATTSAKASAGVKTGTPPKEGKPTTTKSAIPKSGATATASASFDVTLPSITVGSGVKEGKPPCPNTTEVTNGIDDDCDGQIDENEVGSGPLQITLWWEGGGDLDLRVHPGNGGIIDYKNKKGTSGGGGFMDKDSRSSCKGGETVENIYWADNPPTGIYKVNVNYYSSCGDKSEPPMTANVTVSYQGQILGPYSVELNKGDEVTVLEFNLEE